MTSRRQAGSKRSGIPRGRIIREQLEKARDGGAAPFLIAFANANDKYHPWAAHIAAGVTEPLLTCEAAIPVLSPPED